MNRYLDSERFVKPLALLLTVMFCLPAAMIGQSAPDKTAGPYFVGPEDVITVRVQDLEEFSTPNLGAVRVDNVGDIRLPLVGRIHAAGLSVDQLENTVRLALLSIMNAPQVSITVTEFGSRPVSILGAVRNPGVRQISGRKTLFEVLSLAGGLNPDAGNVIMITRRMKSGPLPISGSKTDSTGEYLVGELKVRAVMEAQDPSENIDVMPNDVITIPKAELVYVIGAVKKSGGFVLNEKEQMSALQALSLAEGLDTMASAKAARVLRQNEPGTVRARIAVNLRSILEGSTPDFLLNANDILFVPDSKSKNITIRALEVAIQMGTGVVIWRH